MLNIAYLQLGSNLGNRLQHIEHAKMAIIKDVGIILKSSAIYETAAWGLTVQPDFLNSVIQISTRFDPFTLLDNLLHIETNLGRVRKEKWAPRTIDIDILFYNHLIIKCTELEIPHPFVHLRKFVLIPLTELNGDLVHPVLNLTISEILHQCSDESHVTLYK